MSETRPDLDTALRQVSELRNLCLSLAKAPLLEAPHEDDASPPLSCPGSSLGTQDAPEAPAS